MASVLNLTNRKVIRVISVGERIIFDVKISHLDRYVTLASKQQFFIILLHTGEIEFAKNKKFGDYKSIAISMNE